VNGSPLGVAGEWNDVHDDDDVLYFFVEYEPVDGIEEETESIFSIYPNPVTDRLFLKTDAEVQVESIHFYDVSGQLVQLSTKNWVKGIDVSTLKAGTYFIEIKLDNGVLFTEKFIK
jgi:hypothetical protein